MTICETRRPAEWWVEKRDYPGGWRDNEWWIERKIHEFSKFVLPIVRRVHPNMIAQDTLGVHPMTGSPIGYLLLTYHYKNPAMHDVGYIHAPYLVNYRTPSPFGMEDNLARRTVAWLKKAAKMLRNMADRFRRSWT